MKAVAPSLVLVLIAAAPPALAQGGGQADLAIQGYYLRTGSQLTSGTTGVALKFEEFLPNTGLLRGNLEAYRSGGALQPADNYLQLRGWVWKGLRWNIDAGDFRAPGTLLRSPFTNLFFPEINARGAQVEVGDSRRSFTIFYGAATLLAGPRIPFRIRVPQTVMGAALRQTFGKLETGLRLIRLENTPRDPGQELSFPMGCDFRFADNLTAYASYAVNEHFRWYGEATAARARSADGAPQAQPFSYVVGPVWESPRLTVRANYAELTRTYLPLAGYWIGDRKGPFGELHVRPLRRVEFYGSASQYETASKPSEGAPWMKSEGTSAGASFEMPWQWSASGQVSTTDFRSSDRSTGAEQHSRDRQWAATLSRAIGAHRIRLTAREMRLAFNGTTARERSAEVEDTVQFRHVMLGASVRAQQSAGTERRNTIYARGTAQITLGRFSAFGFFEDGKDLADRTVFATMRTNSAVVNASVRVSRRWSVQAEAFRSRLVSQINPENLFVQGNQNLALNPVLSQFGQWSFLFRVTRTFQWGATLPPMGLEQYTVRRIPITGIVEGYVRVLTAAGLQAAPDVVVALESGHSAKTDAGGKYRLTDVPEGPHVVQLDLEQLPADYNPGPHAKTAVIIGARKIARADLDVFSLGALAGKVRAVAGSQFETLEGIRIRLEPGDRYTTTARDGSFAFYNVPDGDYQVQIASEALPAEARLLSESVVRVAMRTGSAPSAVQFDVERAPAAVKPVRRVIDKVQDDDPAPPPPPANQVQLREMY